MAKGRKERGGGERIRGLFEAGDHRRAADEARAVLADPEAPPADRDAAARALASLRPERTAAIAGLVGVAVAIAVTVLTVLRS